MKWRFWEKPKRSNAGGSSTAEQRSYKPQAVGSTPTRPTNLVEVDALGLGTKGKMLVSANLVPMIHQITAPIIWRDHPIGTRYGPARCNLECTEAHAWAEKINANTVAFERPCEIADMGAAEWRARQRR